MDDLDLKYIDDYLENRLSASQRKQFESRLEHEPELFEEFAFRKSAFQFLLKEKTEGKLKSTFNDLGAKYFDAEPHLTHRRKPNNLRFFWFAAAAAIMLLVIVRPWGEPDLYSKHGAHTTLALVEKSDNSALYQEAEKYFNTGDYENASTSLESLLGADPSNNKVKMALGICALEQDDFQIAESYFDQLVLSNTSFTDYGLWYMALSSIKQGKIDKASSYLDQISPSDDPYLMRKKEALLKDLR